MKKFVIFLSFALFVIPIHCMKRKKICKTFTRHTKKVRFNTNKQISRFTILPIIDLEKKLIISFQPHLSNDISNIIYNYLYINTDLRKSLMNIARTIRSLACTTSTNNQILNRNSNCLTIIKIIAQDLYLSDEIVAYCLQTKAAKRLLLMQNKIKKACSSNCNPHIILDLLKQSPNCNFTYSKRCPQIAISSLPSQRDIWTPIDIWTPFMLLNKKSPDKDTLITFLIKKGANINDLSSTGETVAMTLLRKDVSFHIIEQILDSQTLSPNYQDENGNTLLHKTLQIPHLNNRHRLVQKLLTKGADPTIPNKNGITPITIAEKDNLKRIAKCFRQNNFNKNMKKLI